MSAGIHCAESFLFSILTFYCREEMLPLSMNTSYSIPRMLDGLWQIHHTHTSN